MKERILDEVTKALATATSRRQALRRIGGILGGTALAGLFPGLALANNSGAAHFCASVFGANTHAAGQCTSDAAHGTGLYYNSNCGGGTQSVCCPTNSNGQCTSYSSATCCSGGQTCTNGTCAAVCLPDGASCTTAADCCSNSCVNCTGPFICGTPC